MNETKSLIPPSFVNVPSDPVYDAELPDPLFRTYIRLRGLAWQSKYQETPPLRVEELAELCHHNIRSMWGHLSALRGLGLVTWHTAQGRMVFDLQPLQKFAVDHDGVVATDPPGQEQQQQQPLLQTFAVDPPSLQNFAADERRAANLAALAAYGVDASSPAAQETAQLDHVTPDLVRAWGEHLRSQPCRNLPGLLLYKLRTTQSPPRTDERRGGSRQGISATSSPQDAADPHDSVEQPEREIITIDISTGMLKRRPARGDRGAVALLLEDFGIVAPACDQVIARSPRPDDVRGWMLYALGQPGLDGKAQGYVVNRLLAGETPPDRFRRWAQLEPEDWQALWRAGRYSTACTVSVSLAAWREDFAGIFPVGPFGDGESLVPEAEPAVTAQDEGSSQAAEWEAVLGDLQLQMTQATFDAWLRDSRLIRCIGDTFVIEVKSAQAREWLTHRLRPVITRTLSRRTGHPVGVEFVVPEEGLL